MIDKASLVRRQLRASVATLAASAMQQRAYLRALGDVGVDELALELDDICDAALHGGGLTVPAS